MSIEMCASENLPFSSASRFKDRHANTQKPSLNFVFYFFVLVCFAIEKTSTQPQSPRFRFA
jgi:hypothetical protein